MSYENDAVRGTSNFYGPRSTDSSFGGTVTNRAGKRTVVYEFDFDNLPEASTINLDALIPSGAVITEAEFRVLTAFTSTSTTSDLLVGLADADGGSTITDADGVFTAAELTQTVIAATGVTHASSGALLNTPLSENAVLTVAPSADDLLTGRARIEVTYKATPVDAVPTGTPA